MKDSVLHIVGVLHHLFSGYAESRPTKRSEDAVAPGISNLAVGMTMNATVDFNIKPLNPAREVQAVGERSVLVDNNRRSYFVLRSESDIRKPRSEQKFFGADERDVFPCPCAAPTPPQVRREPGIFEQSGLLDAIWIFAAEHLRAFSRCACAVMFRRLSANTTRQLLRSAFSSSPEVPRLLSFLRFRLAGRGAETPSGPSQKATRRRLNDGFSANFAGLFHPVSLSQFLAGAVA